MNSSRRGEKGLRVLTKRTEEILQAVYFYRYMTAQDVTHLLFSPKSLTYVRSLLSSLSGGTDFKTNEYLYRFPMPVSGSRTKVYTLGAAGRDFLAREVGVPVFWYFRPEKVKHLSYAQVTHNLLLTRFLVAAAWWSEKLGGYKLQTVRTCYELNSNPSAVEILRAGKAERHAAVPDGWLLFEELKNGVHVHFRPVLLEIDRGTEYQSRFKKHIEDRVEFIESGGYRRLFGIEAVVIAYVTTGDTPEYRETRRRSMCIWTKEVLESMHKESWAPLFRIQSVCFEDMYKAGLFKKQVWYRPDLLSPVGLFTG